MTIRPCATAASHRCARGCCSRWRPRRRRPRRPTRCRRGTTARPRHASSASCRRSPTQSGKDYVAPADRIAVFDNDGTLWSEQPVYFQLLFAIDRVKALAPKHPEWKTKQPFKAVLEGDMKALAASGEKGLLELVMATHAGMTTDEFAAVVKDWLATAKHPKFEPPVHRSRLSADARAARLSARQRLQDLHRLGRRHRVHARVLRSALRHSAGAGDRLEHQDEVRGARRQAGDRAPAARSTSSTTRPASRSASTSSSASGRSRRSATPTATSRCCSGRRRRRARGSG